ncbi:spore germination protein [Rossellomorea sp. SC111]|uniref:spore germination protein n=1 Tax=Rossellomorea sp. SC111 TaxID=2968985 RepID=UPI00215AF2A2|nr:spore germination protein [Rossellomorea sp. SC111]MCR8847234.1 spore germination protein [Rossellomorea sp. SC111]
MFKRKESKKSIDQGSPHSFDIEVFHKELLVLVSDSEDLVFRVITKGDQKIAVAYFDDLINPTSMQDSIIRPLEESKEELNHHLIKDTINIAKLTTTNAITDVVDNLVNGTAYIFKEGDTHGILADVADKGTRALEKAETESLVFGPKISFTESITKNLNLIRSNINDPKLCVETFMLGSRTKKKVQMVYISDIAEEENVNTFRQRITEIEIDSIVDSTVLAQLIEDNSFTFFPQFITTELPDRCTISLLHGKIALLVDRSPTAIIGPSTFMNFFESTEDIYMRWNMGTFLRMIRFVAIFFSILLTPAYVAVLTYHYEVIPSALLVSLGQSRSNVPFPPVFEALLLEFIIELLREAGARLPTKVGQTMGIVGGIVIGQASVQAGFTSNILIIIIAISALGSFTAPSYAIGTAVRIIRFPIIVMAGLFGGVGIMFCFCFILIHLLKITTLGRPYLSPIYPFRFSDLKYSIFRMPYQYLVNRPVSNHPIDKGRIPIKKAKMKKDVDE